MSLASHLWPLKDETSYKDKGKILRELHKRRQTMKVLLSREDKNPKKKKKSFDSYLFKFHADI